MSRVVACGRLLMHAAGEASTYSSGDERGRWCATARLHTSGPRSRTSAVCCGVCKGPGRADGRRVGDIAAWYSTRKGYFTVRVLSEHFVPTCSELCPNCSRVEHCSQLTSEHSITLRNSSDDRPSYWDLLLHATAAFLRAQCSLARADSHTARRSRTPPLLR